MNKNHIKSKSEPRFVAVECSFTKIKRALVRTAGTIAPTAEAMVIYLKDGYDQEKVENGLNEIFQNDHFAKGTRVKLNKLFVLKPLKASPITNPEN